MKSSQAIPVLCVLLLTLAAVPAMQAGGHHYNGSITPLQTGYAVTSAHDFRVYLSAGEKITAKLDWSDARADLDLVLLAPGATCPIVSPDVNCIEASVHRQLTCADQPGRTTLGTSPEAFELRATTTGWHKVSVQVALGVPGIPIPYALTVEVEDVPVYLWVVMPTSYVQGSLGCRVVG